MRKRKQSGQVFVLSLPLMLLLVFSLYMLWDSGSFLRLRSQGQQAADAAAYSVAEYGARQKNFTSYMNRAMVANEVSAGQLVALSSWTRRYASLQEQARKSPTIEGLNAIPVVGETLYGGLMNGFGAVSSVFGAADKVVNPFSKAGSWFVEAFNNYFVSGFSQLFRVFTAQSQLEAGGMSGAALGLDRQGDVLHANAPDLELGALGTVALLGSVYYQQFHLQPAADATALTYMAGLVDKGKGEFLENRRATILGGGFGASLDSHVKAVYEVRAGLDFGLGLGVDGGSEYRAVTVEEGAAIEKDRYTRGPPRSPTVKERFEQALNGVRDIKDQGFGSLFKSNPKAKKPLGFAWSSVDVAALQASIGYHLYVWVPVKGTLVDTRSDKHWNLPFDIMPRQQVFSSRLEGLAEGKKYKQGTTLLHGLRFPGENRRAVTGAAWGYDTPNAARKEVYGGLWSRLSDHVSLTEQEAVQKDPDLKTRGLPKYVSFDRSFWKSEGEPEVLPFIVAAKMTPQSDFEAGRPRSADAFLGETDGLFSIGSPGGVKESPPAVYVYSGASTFYDRGYDDNTEHVSDRPSAFNPYWEAHLVEVPDQAVSMLATLDSILNLAPGASADFADPEALFKSFVRDEIENTIGGLAPIALDSLLPGG